VADGLTGIQEAIARVFPFAQYQYCILHATRSSLNKVRRSDRTEIAEDLKKIYFADTAVEAKNALEVFNQKWQDIYPKVSQFWENNFDSLTTFLQLPSPLRQFVYT